MRKFQIIIPVFQTRRMLLLCIQSLFSTVTYPTELILINDGSDYDCQKFICEQLNSPDLVTLHYIDHPTSMGCPRSINQGLEYITDSAYVIFADSDILFSDGWQDTVINTLEDPSIGAASGLFLYPQTDGIQCCGIAYQNYSARHLFLNNKPENLNLEPVFDVQAAIFAFFATTSTIIKKVGKVDESFFNGYEDVDYQFRMRKMGYRIVTNTEMRFYHYEKSNGIHRAFSRRQNLGIFWSKHADYVKNDLYNYMEKQISSRNILSSHYVLINMCEAKNDALGAIEMLKTKISIGEVIDVSNNCSIEQKIWLSEILSSDSYALPKPYLFLCDNFIELTENSYWFKLRSNYSHADLIIDLYANIIPFSLLSQGFWPGSKIR